MIKALYDVQDIPAASTVAVYGCGSRGQALVQALRRQRRDITVRCFLDSTRAGTCEGLPVVPIGQWTAEPDCRIIVASDFEEQIIASLEQAGMSSALLYRPRTVAYPGHALSEPDIYCPNTKEYKEILMWELLDRPIPAPGIVKRLTLLRYLRAFGLTTFVETGTFLGETLNILKMHVKAAYSIELHKGLYERARELFRYDPQVSLRFGDSGEELRKLLAAIDEPTLFWLDAHYSGEGTALGGSASPILQELEAILQHPVPGHVILIDDARCFDGRSLACTVSAIENVLTRSRRAYRFAVKNDIIRFHPEKALPEWHLSLPLDA